jgi:cobalt/nickel transport system permease protein
MHIPDGYISPSTVIATYTVALPLWVKAFNELKKSLDEESLPLLSSLSALSFIIMMFNIPIPGGTSGHALGVALIAIVFGPWIGALSLSVVLFIQALVFGDGGISSFALNSLAMGFGGAFSASFAYKKLKEKSYSTFVAGWISAISSSFIVALILGIQPLIATSSDGKPLYFPFDLSVTIPALVGSHIVFFGVVEGIFTKIAYKVLEKLEPNSLKEVKNEI